MSLRILNGYANNYSEILAHILIDLDFDETSVAWNAFKFATGYFYREPFFCFYSMVFFTLFGYGNNTQLETKHKRKLRNAA